MNSAPLNPFRPTRWEHQRDGFQLIWFTKTAQLLAGDKSVYVRGSRGSGKTTLLKSICWEDLAGNSSLRLQRTMSDFEHIGLYIRFPDHLSTSIGEGSWIKAFPNIPQPQVQYHKYFSLLVELTCLERALMAVHELRLIGSVQYTPVQELNVVDAVNSEFPAISSFDDSAPATFAQLSRTMRAMVRRMNDALGRGTLEKLVEVLPGREPGEMLSFVAKRLADAIRLSSLNGGKKVAFKFCLDDCEVLSNLQQKSVNTLVRVSQYPVSWVVSSVGALYDSTETFLEQQPLTDADRRIIQLDRRTDFDFRELCQAVVSLRLLFSVSEKTRIEHKPTELADFFPLADSAPDASPGRPGRLGTRNVNDIIEAIATKSTSPMAEDLISAAKKLQLALNAQKQPHVNEKSIGKRNRLPLYESYVLLLWQGREDSFRTSFSSDDIEALNLYAPNFQSPNFSAWLRRKQRAALLHFASSLGFRRLPLAGASIVVSLADGSIRDFLEIMGEIYEAYTKARKLDSSKVETMDRFATSRTTIAFDTQADGIYAASSSYLAGVSSRADRNSDVVNRLIEGLGYYTSALQSSADDPSVLGRAERGVFVVKFSSNTPAFIGDSAPDKENAVWRTIRQAEIAGYLRTVSVKQDDVAGINDADGQRGKSVTFRLHRRFAPHFRFSFRGAYEVVALAPASLWPLCDPGAPADPREWAEAQFRGTPLFEEAQLTLWDALDMPND